MLEVYISNYNVAIARLLAAILFIPLLAFISLALFLEHETHGWGTLLVAMMAPIGIVGFAMGLLTLTFSITFGDGIWIRTILGSKRYALSEIERINFGIERHNFKGISTKHLMMHVRLKTRMLGYEVKVSSEEKEHVQRFLRRHGLGGNCEQR